ncbi:MAG: transglycosylase SLT domain-containing protein [Pseudoflavonifractor sp.]|nr:transglycosylase SLT domain-containing protein [Pseudoflavonifractor sp.]
MNRRLTRLLPGLLVAIMAAATVVGGCHGNGGNSDTASDSVDHRLPDTLRVGTLYSPQSYFIYREQQMGYDYDLVSKLGADKGMVIDLNVAASMAELIGMLDSGAIDLIAYEVPITAEYKDRVLPCGNENITHQVLVQPKRDDDSRISDVTQLVGKDVYVEKDSKYQHRLNNLNNELGGGIKIHPIDRDTLITEDLIAMVSEGTIPLTVVDSDIARINKTYYDDLDITLEVSFPQRSSWGVSPTMPWLGDSISEWMREDAPRRTQAQLMKRYFEMSKNEGRSLMPDLTKGRISPYDNLFKRYAKSLGWDWRLLASQGFAESRFDSTVVSWAGAQGIMQIMPGTARAYGLPASRITNPEASIKTATDIIRDLDKSLSTRVKNPEERKKFIVAAYNSGIAHVYDAIALAAKYGKNPQLWYGNVEEAIMMKSKPEYYNDPVCKYGYFRGRQTTAYVKKVFDFYNRTKQHVKL